MFSQSSKVTVFNAVPVWSQQSRGMATLKHISMRLRSVKNIQKITQSMKMVSAAKYARAERELKLARPFGVGAQAFYEKAEVKAPEEGKVNKLYIAMSSDRGLCGAIHSSVVRLIRGQLLNSPENIKVICIGDKSRMILQRLFAKNILFTAKEIGRTVSTFEDAGLVAEQILNCGYNFDVGSIVHNRFKSVVSYMTVEIPLFSDAAINAAPKLVLYDSLDSDVQQCYNEFSLAANIFYTLKEGACSEQSARMSAMDNASSNASEMISKLQLTYNRTRQAVITRELIEIISGASALE